MISTDSAKNNSRWLALRTAIRGRIFAAAIAIIVVGGCSVSGPSLVPSATNVEFGNVAVGASTSQLVTLTNKAKVNVNIANISVSGEGFSVSGGSHATLAPGQAVTVSIGFNPKAAGKATGAVSVTSDALSGGHLQIALSGSAEGTAGKHSVALSWQASSSSSVGYVIYRSSQESGQLSRLNATLNESTSFTDNTVASGETYEYVVTSVNSANVESAASNQITVTIPSP